MELKKALTTDSGAPVTDNQNSRTAGPGGPVLLEDHHLIEKLAHFDRERIPERVVHAKGSGAYGHFEVLANVTQWTKAKFLAPVGKRTEIFIRFSTVAGEKGSADTRARMATVRTRKTAEPNSLGGPQQTGARLWAPIEVAGLTGNHAPEHRRDNNDFVQAGDLYRLMSEAEKQRSIANIAASLSQVSREDVIEPSVANFRGPIRSMAIDSPRRWENPDVKPKGL
jgi:catalase